MSVKNWIIGGGAALGAVWGVNAILNLGEPEGCFRNNADNDIYLVEDGKATIANNRWQMNNGKTKCFIPDNGPGPTVIVPVIEYP